MSGSLKKNSHAANSRFMWRHGANTQPWLQWSKGIYSQWKQVRHWGAYSRHTVLRTLMMTITQSAPVRHSWQKQSNLYWQMKPQTGFIQNPEIQTEEQKLLNSFEQRDDTMWLKTPRGQRFNLKLNKTSPTQHETVRVSAPVQVRGQPTRFQPCCCPRLISTDWHYGS